MSNLDWCVLVEKFYAFKSKAAKYNFYTPELEKMAKSLIEIKPFASNEEETNKVLEKLKEA